LQQSSLSACLFSLTKEFDSHFLTLRSPEEHHDENDNYDDDGMDEYGSCPKEEGVNEMTQLLLVVSRKHSDNEASINIIVVHQHPSSTDAIIILPTTRSTREYKNLIQQQQQQQQ
jgi:hypothetical protein